MTRHSLVFTSLSHDIVAHEMTHALLDGVHPRFDKPINPDVVAFHEAFADIVALLTLHLSGRVEAPDSAGPAATWRPRTCSRNSRRSLVDATGGAARCAMLFGG